MTTRFVRFVFFPLLVVACGDDTVVVDAGAEGGKDATIDVAKDVATDVTIDAPKDVTLDAPQDVTLDAPADASVDVVDAAADVVDASLDAADGGSTYHTPTCDGTVSASEYGGAEYVTTSGSQTWYITWDATNLYVGLDNATLSEANVLYLGFSGNGYQTAQTYDTTGGTLPFLADGVVYAKTGYQESRIATSSAWGTPSTSTVTFCSSGTTREEVIPWTALGASSIPSAFRFFAYATSGTGFVYGQIPTSLPSGNVGTSANWNHDFYIASTNNGFGNFPFDTTE